MEQPRLYIPTNNVHAGVMCFLNHRMCQGPGHGKGKMPPLGCGPVLEGRTEGPRLPTAVLCRAGRTCTQAPVVRERKKPGGAFSRCLAKVLVLGYLPWQPLLGGRMPPA